MFTSLAWADVKTGTLRTKEACVHIPGRKERAGGKDAGGAASSKRAGTPRFSQASRRLVTRTERAAIRHGAIRRGGIFHQCEELFNCTRMRTKGRGRYGTGLGPWGKKYEFNLRILTFLRNLNVLRIKTFSKNSDYFFPENSDFFRIYFFPQNNNFFLVILSFQNFDVNVKI